MFAALIAAVPAASAATCSNASLNGVYGIISSGLNGSLQPATSVNRVSLDGAGNATGSATKSIDGTIVTYTFTGTYQIAKNCTGTATWTNQDGATEHDNIYLNNGNKGGFLIQTDANHVQSSVGVSQGTAKCTNAGVKHAYSLQLTGTVISVGQIAVGGQISLDGKGSVSGTATLSLNGTIENSLTVTGTYSINSDCTGTAQITPQGLSPINLSLLVVNADKEIMAIETDTNTIVSGTLVE
jgi:hypothetical protein